MAGDVVLALVADEDRPPDIDHRCRRNVEPTGGGTDTASLSQSSPDTILDTVRDDWATNALASRHGLRLPPADGLGELGATVDTDEVEHGESAAAGIDALIVQKQADTMIAKKVKDFEQVRDRPAGQIAGISDNNLIDLIQLRDQLVPAGVLAPADNPAIVDERCRNRVATGFDRVPEVGQSFRVKHGLTSIDGGSLHGLDWTTLRQIVNEDGRTIYGRLAGSSDVISFIQNFRTKAPPRSRRWPGGDGLGLAARRFWMLGRGFLNILWAGRAIAL
jgi:hypothetical protein